MYSSNNCKCKRAPNLRRKYSSIKSEVAATNIYKKSTLVSSGIYFGYSDRPKLIW